jgi:mRNA interferase RelE/StbE
VEFVLGDLSLAPRRFGKPLRPQLTGTWSARRGPYRIIYTLDEERRIVAVLRIEHRADVYRSR